MLTFQKPGFVGREHEQQVFRQYLEMKTRPLPILSVSGPGGIGKTALLRRFNEIAIENGFVVIQTDLESNRTVLDILNALTLSVKGRKFKKFKTAKNRLGKIWGKVAKLSPANADRISSFSKDVTSAGVGGTLGTAIGGPAGFLIGAVAGTVGGIVTEEMTKKGISVFVDLGLSTDDAAFAMAPSRTLTLAFLQDLEGMSKKCKLILMLDAYERVSRLDEWFRFEFFGGDKDFLGGIHTVIGGRDPLPLDWRKLNQQIISLPLSAFSLTEVGDYMRSIGITSEEQISSIINESDCIPLLVEMLSEALVLSTQSVQQERQDITVSHLIFAERILDHLSPEQQAVVEAASILRGFDQDLLSAILGEQISKDDFSVVIGLSFTNMRDREKWALREETRSAIAGELKRRSPRTFNQYHESALTWFLEQSGYPHGQLDLSSALEAIYHGFQRDRVAGLHLYQGLFEWVSWPPNLMACEALIVELDIAVSTKLCPPGYLEYYEARLHFLKNEWQDAKNLFRRVGNSPENEALLQALAFQQLGQIEFNQGYLDIAFTVFRRAHALFQELDFTSGINAMLNNLGRISRRMGRRDLAMAYHRTVIERISQSELEAPQQLIDAHRCISRLHRDQGQWSKAIESCNESLKLAQGHGYRYEESMALIRLAELHCYQGRWDDAYIACETAIPILNSYENDLPIAAAYGISGRVATWTQQIDQALSHFLNSLWYYTRLSANIGIVLLYLDMARLFLLCGVDNRALSYADNAIHISKNIGDEALEAISGNVKAEVLRAKGKWHDAKALYEQSRAIFHVNGDCYREAEASIGLAICKWNLSGDEDKELLDNVSALLGRERYPDLSARLSILTGAIQPKRRKAKSALDELRDGFRIAAEYARPLAVLLAREVTSHWNVPRDKQLENILSLHLGPIDTEADFTWIETLFQIDYESGELRPLMIEPMVRLSRDQCIVLIHHALSKARVEGLMQGRYDSSLDPRTQANLPKIAENLVTKLETLPIELTTIPIYCSPAKRAYETVFGICNELHRRTNREPQIRVLQALENMSLGSWEGKSKLNLQEDPVAKRLSSGRDFLVKAPGLSSDGSQPESLLQVLDRFCRAFMNILRNQQSAIFVGHKMSLIIPGVLALAPNLLLDPDGVINWRKLEFLPGGYVIFHGDGHEICPG